MDALSAVTLPPPRKTGAGRRGLLYRAALRPLVGVYRLGVLSISDLDGHDLEIAGVDGSDRLVLRRERKLIPFAPADR